jgi:antitoxin (DNA-binding transcriptional repressor) of toxin-antitoxin stability system
VKITAEDLKSHFDDSIAAVEAGQPMTIVNDAGDPIAEIQPPDESQTIVVRHDPARRLSEFVPGPRPPRLDFDAVQWLIHDRERSRY